MDPSPIPARGPLCLIPAWKSNHTLCKVWDEITYAFPNFNGCTVDVWEWISNFTTHFITMTSSNGNIFRLAGHLCGEFTGDRWSPRSPVNSPHKGQWRGALIFSLICAWINGWVNNREAGDLRRHRAHYDVNVMKMSAITYSSWD